MFRSPIHATVKNKLWKEPNKKLKKKKIENGSLSTIFVLRFWKYIQLIYLNLINGFLFFVNYSITRLILFYFHNKFWKIKTIAYIY